MDRARHKRNYDLHSWTGVVLGMFLFVVCFSGTLALFYSEVQAWEDPAERIALPEVQAKIGPTFSAWTEGLETTGEIEFMSLSFPIEGAPYFRGYAHVHTPDGEHIDHMEYWHGETLAPFTMQGDGMSRWLLDFHRDLMWPAKLGGGTVGQALVGLAGVILILSIITGVIAHTKIREEIFTLRYARSMRLKWQDTHKVFGLWGLPFFAMIGLTGAVLGIVTILAPLVALLAFKGDQEALIEAVIGQPPEPVGEQVHMVSIDELAAMRHPESERAPNFLVFHNWGDKAAVADVYFLETEKLLISKAISVSGATGAPTYNPVTATDTPGNRLVAAMSPLHFGTFGGIALKLLYALLGLSLAIVTALGTMMWIERRLHGNEGGKSARFYRGLSRLNVGVCTGLATASSGLLAHSVLYAGDEGARLFWTGAVYFALWFAALGYAFVRKDEYRANAELIALAGGLCVLAAALNMALTDQSLAGLAVGDVHASTAWVDLSLLVVGIVSIAVAARLPKRRADKRRKSDGAPTPIAAE